MVGILNYFKKLNKMILKLKIGTLSVHVSAHGDALLPRASINTQ
jgi:hypothetical protein